jgi:hypothetical protein
VVIAFSQFIDPVFHALVRNPGLEPEEVVPGGSLTTPPCEKLSHAQEIKD